MIAPDRASTAGAHAQAPGLCDSLVTGGGEGSVCIGTRHSRYSCQVPGAARNFEDRPPLSGQYTCSRQYSSLSIAFGERQTQYHRTNNFVELGVNMDNDGALTVNAFCERYGIGRTLTYELLSEGRIKAKKVRNRTLISRESAATWFNSEPDFVSNSKEVF